MLHNANTCPTTKSGLTQYWTSGHMLPECTILKRRLNIVSPDEDAALLEILAEFFPKDSLDKYCHLELDRQLTGISEFSATQSANASKPRPKPSSSEEDDGGKF